MEFRLPSLGENIQTADVVKVLIAKGEAVKKDQPVLELETGKAIVELPSPSDGKVSEVYVKAGETIKVDQLILVIDSAEQSSTAVKKEKAEPAVNQAPEISLKNEIDKQVASEDIPAAPAARRLARELGILLTSVKGSGPQGLILIDDVRGYAKQAMSAGDGSQSIIGLKLGDISRFGPVERKPMTTLRRQTAMSMAKAWANIPHVTHCDSADITELEKLRKQFGKRAEAGGGKLTMTVMILKTVAAALKVFPQFNASIDMEMGDIVYKKYVHLGVAVDTAQGLLVPVIRDADKKNIIELSIELAKMADKAKSRKLTLDEMQGGSFTVTNLGGIGGTHFTPIINHPEVAILGVGRSQELPQYIDGKLEPRLIMPLSLSYDHRLIDGADAARFTRWLADALAQPFLMDLEG